HDGRAESVALVPDIVEHNDSRQQRTPDHRNEAEWNHQNDARCEQTEADPRDRGRANFAGMNRTSRAVPRIDGAIEKIVEVHAADVEGGHCYHDQRDLIRMLATAGNDLTGK